MVLMLTARGPHFQGAPACRAGEAFFPGVDDEGRAVGRGEEARGGDGPRTCPSGPGSRRFASRSLRAQASSLGSCCPPGVAASPASVGGPVCRAVAPPGLLTLAYPGQEGEITTSRPLKS